MTILQELKKSITETEEFIKSHVTGYTRTTASGASVQVAEHDDSRTPAQKKAHSASDKANSAYNEHGAKTHTQSREEHESAAWAHHHAASDVGIHHKDYMGHKKSEYEHNEKADEHATATSYKKGDKVTDRYGKPHTVKEDKGHHVVTDRNPEGLKKTDIIY